MLQPRSPTAVNLLNCDQLQWIVPSPHFVSPGMTYPTWITFTPSSLLPPHFQHALLGTQQRSLSPRPADWSL